MQWMRETIEHLHRQARLALGESFYTHPAEHGIAILDPTTTRRGRQATSWLIPGEERGRGVGGFGNPQEGVQIVAGAEYTSCEGMEGIHVIGGTYPVCCSSSSEAKVPNRKGRSIVLRSCGRTF